jgi:hypothetical protein
MSEAGWPGRVCRQALIFIAMGEVERVWELSPGTRMLQEFLQEDIQHAAADKA